jgi:drug/metabolite transporter (DMT)-like permease
MITRLRAIERAHQTPAAGLALAAMTAVVSGVAVFLNATAVRAVGDPALFTTLKNAVSAVVLVGVALVLVPDPGRAIRRIPGRGLAALVAIGVVGGSVPFLLFFTGLAQASAPAAAVIHKTLFVWVAVLAAVLLRERLGWLQAGALATLLVAQLLIQPPDGVRWTSGESMIAAATLLWAVEVIVAKRAFGTVPAPVAAAARMGIGLVVLMAVLGTTGGLARIGAVSVEGWAWVAGTGLLLAAYVATWYAALARASATAVTAILTLGAPITAALQLVAGGTVPTPAAGIGYGAVAVAAIALVALALRAPARTAAAAV